MTCAMCNYGSNLGCWWPIRFENCYIVLISLSKGSIFNYFWFFKLFTGYQNSSHSHTYSSGAHGMQSKVLIERKKEKLTFLVKASYLPQIEAVHSLVVVAMFWKRKGKTKMSEWRLSFLWENIWDKPTWLPFWFWYANNYHCHCHYVLVEYNLWWQGCYNKLGISSIADKAFILCFNSGSTRS